MNFVYDKRSAKWSKMQKLRVNGKVKVNGAIQTSEVSCVFSNQLAEIGTGNQTTA